MYNPTPPSRPAPLPTHTHPRHLAVLSLRAVDALEIERSLPRGEGVPGSSDAAPDGRAEGLWPSSLPSTPAASQLDPTSGVDW